MSREIINLICAEFPGAEKSDPWGGGHDAWKVGGKMFACIGAVQEGVSVKTEGVEQAEMLIMVGAATKAPYFHRSWVHMPFDTPVADLRHRIAESYAIIRKALPRTVQASLDRTSG